MFQIAVGDYLECKIYCWHAGASQLAINTVRLEVFSASLPGPFDSRDVADALSETFAPQYKLLLDSGVTYAGVSVQDFPARLAVATFSIEEQGAGGVAGNDVPTQSSGLITLKSNFAKRWGRGRLYIPFPSSASNDTNGTPTATYMTNLASLAALFQDPGFTASVDPSSSIVRFKTHVCDSKKLRPEYKVVKRAIAQDNWATQRRRGGFGRKNTLPVELVP